MSAERSHQALFTIMSACALLPSRLFDLGLTRRGVAIVGGFSRLLPPVNGKRPFALPDPLDDARLPFVAFD